MAAWPRGVTTGTSFARPLTADEALDVAGALVIGVVTEQRLARGKDERSGLPVTLLVSTIRASAGPSTTVSQPTGVAHNARGDLSLQTSPAHPLLSGGTEYAVLVLTQGGEPTPRLIWGHAYEVIAGALRPLTQIPETKLLAGLSVSETLAVYETARPE